MPSFPPEVWVVFLLLAAAAALGFLRVVGFEYYNAVLWHNLKVEVHRLRLQQQNRLETLARGELATRRDDATAGTIGAANDGDASDETARAA